MAVTASRIRWDRVGRWALLCVLALILYLYIGPTRSWVSAYGEAGERRAQVNQLARENAKLRGEARSLESPDAVEARARRLGMVRAGERQYVVQGLPRQR